MNDPMLNNLTIAMFVGFTILLVTLLILALVHLREHDLLPQQRREPVIVDDTHLLIVRREDAAGDLLKVSAALCLLAALVRFTLSYFADLLLRAEGEGVMGILKALLIP